MMYITNHDEKEGNNMRKLRKRTFEELVQENKRQLLEDRDALEAIEGRIEKRLEARMLEAAE